MCYNMCYTVNLHVKTNDGYINIFFKCYNENIEVSYTTFMGIFSDF